MVQAIIAPMGLGEEPQVFKIVHSQTDR